MAGQTAGTSRAAICRLREEVRKVAKLVLRGAEISARACSACETTFSSLVVIRCTTRAVHHGAVLVF